MSKKKTTTTRRKKSPSKKQSISKVKLINIFLLIFLFAFIASILSYYIMKNENSNKSVTTTNDILKKETSPKVQKLNEDIKNYQSNKLDKFFDINEPKEEKFEEVTEEFNKTYDEKPEEVKEEIKKPLKEENKKPLTPKKTEENKKEIKKPLESKTKKPIIDNKKVITKRDTFKYNKTSKPKIVIMIDDVSTKRQKRNILNIGYKINMAFLPPTKGHPNSAKIAKDVPFHLIHFPMQASAKFKGAEIGTLNITDSYEKIEKRVKQLRAWFPKTKYTNNHTGSVFTQNDAAMDKLFRALKKYNFIFVDSRTSAKSVAKKYALKYGMPYIVRNTFLDNKKDYDYIQNQLKKAIKIAKKRGYAIAIGHPHSMTIKVLRESKHLLKDVEPIFINKLPYL